MSAQCVAGARIYFTVVEMTRFMPVNLRWKDENVVLAGHRDELMLVGIVAYSRLERKYVPRVTTMNRCAVMECYSPAGATPSRFEP